MKVYIGADHRGYDYKQKIIGLLQKLGHKVIDLGTYDSIQSCDYPDVAMDVGVHVSQDRDARGILICMSGIGQTIAANKVKGVYAALCYNLEAAELSRKHNNANVLVLSSKFVTDQQLPQILNTWMTTPFEGGRHETRVAKIKQMEEQFGRAGANDLYAFLPPLTSTEASVQETPAKDVPAEPVTTASPVEEKAPELGSRRRRPRGGRRHSRNKTPASEKTEVAGVAPSENPVPQTAAPEAPATGSPVEAESAQAKTNRRPRSRSRGRRGRRPAGADKNISSTDAPASA